MQTITEDEWDERFGWVADENDDHSLIEDTPENRAILGKHDSHYVWSRVDDGEGEGYVIIPGYSRFAIGWYLTQRPWLDDDPVCVKDEA